jgi:adenylate cyclase
MSTSTQGSLEVDQTLRLARDTIEHDIARYRVFVVVATLVATTTTRLTGLSVTWIPTYCYAGALVYALLVLGYLRRYGNPRALAIVALLCDLVTCVAVFVISKHFVPADRSGTASAFVTYLLGPVMVLTLLVNTLRNSTTTALVGGFVGCAIYVPTIVSQNGFHPAEISVGLILIIAGAIGVGSAIQARKTLDSFARLQLLRRYLPPEAVDRVMREDPDAALAPGGRLVTVTLLSADLRGFTAMSEHLSPSEVMAQLNGYHGAMIDVIERHGGAIDKFIGDGTLVVFGLTGETRVAAGSAVACAGEMLDALAAHNEERKAKGSPPLAMGIAVHTGPVIAGNLGIAGKRLEFTVIGDAVNTVSRLEGQTKGSGSPVIVSGDTAALLPSTVTLRELPPVSLRGKTQAVTVFGLARFGGASGPTSSAASA